MTRDTDLIRRGDAMDLRDELADVIGARPLSSIHSALSEYRKAIRALPAHPVQEPPSPGVTAGATGPERIGIISDGMGCWALAHRDEADRAVHYIRADLATPAPVVPAKALELLEAALRREVAYDESALDALDDVRGMIADAIAALHSAQPVGARVKPLVWVDLGADYWTASAPLFGSIRIEPWGDKGFQVLWSVPGFCDRLIKDLFETPAAAKAAAQADYEARIRAALLPAGEGEE